MHDKRRARVGYNIWSRCSFELYNFLFINHLLISLVVVMKIYFLKKQTKKIFFLIVVIYCFILFQVRLRHIEVSGSIYNSNVQRLIDGKKKKILRHLHGLCLPLVATFCIFPALWQKKTQRSAKPIKMEGGGKVKTEDEMMQGGSWSSEETGALWGNQCGRSIFMLKKK